MEKIKVYVERAEDGMYWGSIENIPGGVSAYGKDLEELKMNLENAYEDYLEVARDLNEDWLTDLEFLKEFEYQVDIQSFFKLWPVKISAIAEKAGINPSLMRQYASGTANASEQRAKEIEKAIHELGKDLLSVSL